MARLAVRDFSTGLNLSAGSVDCGAGAKLQTTVFSYEAWIRPIGTGARDICGNTAAGGQKFRVGNGTNDLTLVQNGVSVISTASNAVQMNKWQHVVVTYDTTGFVAFYVNGAQVATQTNLVTFTPTGNFKIGFVANQYSGNMDTVRAWNVALTAQQVSDLYYFGKIQTTNPPAPVGQWLFDEGSGTTAIDSSGNGNNGTITGATYTTDVPMVARSSSANRLSVQNFTSAIHYGGASNRTQSGVTNLPTIQGAKSISMWFKPTAFTGGATIMSYELTGSAGVAWSISGSNVLAVGNWGGGTLCTWSTIPNHQYSFLTYTYDGTNHKTYLNGTLIQTSSTASQTGTATAFYTGAYSGGGGCVGNVADTRIYGRALTDAEVASLYYTGKNPTNTVLWHQFSEGAGTSVTDYSGNGNTGTITGATWTADVPMKARKVVDGNLVKNAGFEYGPPFTAATTTANRWIDGTAAGSTTNDIFGWFRTGAGSCDAQFDTSTKKGGLASLRISTLGVGAQLVLQNHSNGVAAQVKYGAPVLPSTTYKGTFFMKTNYVSGDSNDGAYMNFAECDGGGNGIINNLSTKVKTTTDWTSYSVTFTTNASTRYIIIDASVQGATGTGTLVMDAWFDDIVLKPTTAEARSTA